MQFLAYVTKCGDKYAGLNDTLAKTIHPNTVLGRYDGMEGLEIVLVNGDPPPNTWTHMPMPSGSLVSSESYETVDRNTIEPGVDRVCVVPFPPEPVEVPDRSVRRSVRTMKSHGLEGAITLQSRFVYHKRAQKWVICDSYGMILRIKPDALPDALRKVLSLDAPFEN